MKSHIIRILALLPLFLLTFCINDSEESDLENSSREKENLSFYIKTLNTRAEERDGIVEKIKSLRIVILSDEYIEYNSKIDFSENDRLATAFVHQLRRLTVAGNKKIYLFANEESVSNIKFEGLESLPSGITQGMTLSSFLNHYSKNKLPENGTLGAGSNGLANSGTGREFETCILSAYFTPDYTVDNNTVYLPYTSVYDGIEATNDPEIKIEKTLYLVPVATKFTVNFYNFRRKPVKVEGIALKQFNTYNYLMADLEEEELSKTLDNTTHYWIDWLAKVSERSQSASSPSDYNNLVGWIEGYHLPFISDTAQEGSSNPQNPMIIKEVSGGDNWVINQLVDKNNPNSFSAPAIYCGESMNLVTKTVIDQDTGKEKEITGQAYYIQFRVRDIDSQTIDTTDWFELDMLPFLFRNTHININVEMQEEFVVIYNEIAPWTFRGFKGYLQEEDDD